MVTALRSEMLWWGNEQGFADASETIEATERLLAEIGEGSERSNAKHALALRTLSSRSDPSPSSHSAQVGAGAGSRPPTRWRMRRRPSGRWTDLTAAGAPPTMRHDILTARSSFC